MVNIKVGRYQNVEDWAGWIEPDDMTWIAFIRADGSPVFYLNRDPETGAVLSEPGRPTPEALGASYEGEFQA